MQRFFLILAIFCYSISAPPYAEAAPLLVAPPHAEAAPLLVAPPHAEAAPLLVAPPHAEAAPLLVAPPHAEAAPLLVTPPTNRMSPPTHSGLRLISTSPQVTEILFQLGKGNDIIATSQFSDYPADAKKIPRLGPIFGIGVESILVAAPDWVITDPFASSPLLDRGLSATSLRHFPFPVNSLDSLFEGSEKLLQRLYGNSHNALLDGYRRCLSGISARSPFSFLAFAWLSPPILIGHTTLLSDVIHKTGGVNLLETSIQHPYPRISLEWLIKHRPKIMFILSHTPRDLSQAKALAAQWWPEASVEVRVLDEANFSRSSFSPLLKANQIQEGALPEECQ